MNGCEKHQQAFGMVANCWSHFNKGSNLDGYQRWFQSKHNNTGECSQLLFYIRHGG